MSPLLGFHRRQAPRQTRQAAGKPMIIRMKSIRLVALSAALLIVSTALGQQPSPKAPKDVQPGSITYEEVEYPYPVSYLPLTLYGQDVRMAYMDVPPAGQ